jgi:hypothetical protein
MATLSELLGHQGLPCAECEYDDLVIVVQEIGPNGFEATVDDEFAGRWGDLIQTRAGIARGITSKTGVCVSILETFDGWHNCDA